MGLQSQPEHSTMSFGLLMTPFLAKIWPSPMHRYNSKRVHLYAHPQHMKVLKHFIYIQYGCGVQSAVVFGLSNVTTMTAFNSHTNPKLSKSRPTLSEQWHGGRMQGQERLLIVEVAEVGGSFPAGLTIMAAALQKMAVVDCGGSDERWRSPSY